MTAPVFPRLALLLEMALHVVGGTRVQIAGNSMEPALLPGDRLLVSRLASRWPFAPRRGRIVLLRSAPDTRPESIKRVAGLPGERIALVDGRWLVDGRDLGEPSTPFDGMAAGSAREDKRADREWLLGPRDYFVLGDNRPRSTDSRQFGPVPAETIIGVAWYRYAPPARRGRLSRLTLSRHPRR